MQGRISLQATVLHLMFVLLVGFYSVAAKASTEHVYVRVPIADLSRFFFEQSGFIRDHIIDDSYAFGYLTPEALNSLPANLQHKLVRLDAEAWARNSFDPKTLQRKAEPRESERPPSFEDYHTYETLTSELKALALKYPTLMTLKSAGKSVDGRDLWYVVITSASVATDLKPELLYVSSMHGDEVVGKEMMVYLIRDLLTNYEVDARITNLVNHANLYIMPSMNPDGTVRRQRFNARGVDLNRDFPELDEPPFSGGRAVETQALMQLHKAHHFALSFNFHTGAVCVNIPWDSKPNNSSHFGDDKLILTLAHQYADANGPMHNVDSGSFDHGVTYGFEWYQVLGGMQDWSSYFLESTHATVELSDIKWPKASTLPGFWKDNRESLLTYFESGLVGFHLKVTDEAGNFLTSTVSMSSATRDLHYAGVVNRPAVGGSQTVTVSASGFAPQVLTLAPRNYDGTFDSVVLKK